MNESESGWYLKHRDGVEHGPFLLADLVNAAVDGNIAADTVVKHATHSRDQWVLAMRVSAISQASRSTSTHSGPTPGPDQNASPQTQSPQIQSSAANAQRSASNDAARPTSTAPQRSASRSSATAARSQPNASAIERKQPAPPHARNAASSPSRTDGGQSESAQAGPIQPQRPTQQPRPESAPTSIFRRPETTAAAAQAPAGGANQAVGAGSEEQADSDAVPTNRAPAIRGGRENPFPVPKTFFDAFLALFDFRFRYFITPWIVKIVWGICVAVAILWIVKLAHDTFIQPSVGNESVASDSAAGWQFEPLEGKSLWQSSVVRFLGAMLAIGLTLVIMRVICEAFIVFFYVANHVSDLRQLAKEKAN